MSDYKGIFVVGEIENGSLSSLTRELLGGARRLADTMQDEVGLFLVAKEPGNAGQEGITLGADKVYVSTDPALLDMNPDAYVFVVTHLCSQIKPLLCLIGQTDLGRDLAPRVAARLEAGLCMDCIHVDVNEERNGFIQTRPAYGGKALSVIASTNGRPQVNTVRSKAMEPLLPQDQRTGETIAVQESPDSSSIRIRILEREAATSGGIKLEDAKVIVAGGGGIGGPEGFDMIKDLARRIGGEVGATRVPVDENWVPLSMEIGQTGKIVNPELYIAIGISGAAQHITGCLNSKTIVSINKDPDANIFKISDIGLVGDYRDVLPVLIEKFQER
ncbi:MAG: electron transfer flavoprotein subunit alpha/FixB family protein [Deltaproteobacteria bacterium]|nr:electron transfer flavoprotein subunit alpha/FixB family protein [Deltaproteobacteria bacterium]